MTASPSRRSVRRPPARTGRRPRQTRRRGSGPASRRRVVGLGQHLGSAGSSVTSGPAPWRVKYVRNTPIRVRGPAGPASSSSGLGVGERRRAPRRVGVEAELSSSSTPWAPSNRIVPGSGAVTVRSRRRGRGARRRRRRASTSSQDVATPRARRARGPSCAHSASLRARSRPTAAGRRARSVRRRGGARPGSRSPPSRRCPCPDVPWAAAAGDLAEAVGGLVQRRDDHAAASIISRASASRTPTAAGGLLVEQGVRLDQHEARQERPHAGDERARAELGERVVPAVGGDDVVRRLGAAVEADDGVGAGAGGRGSRRRALPASP